MALSLPAWRIGRLAGFGQGGEAVAVERMFEVIPGYTPVVKTAISIPDETFARAEEHAVALGMSRSEFFTRAVRRYIEHLEAESLTGRINAAIDMAWPDGVTIDAVRYGHRHPMTGDGAW
jgi:antitoxin MazE6